MSLSHCPAALDDYRLANGKTFPSDALSCQDRLGLRFAQPDNFSTAFVYGQNADLGVGISQIDCVDRSLNSDLIRDVVVNSEAVMRMQDLRYEYADYYKQLYRWSAHA